jgi:hypothetical protein
MPVKMKDEEMVGRVFNRLLITSRNGTGDRWDCTCSCGTLCFSKSGKAIRGGGIKSCGCLVLENIKRVIKNNTGVARVHGMTDTKEYVAWRNMKARCDDVAHQAYKNYGGRGISYCSEWKDFVNFYKDMGECPAGFSLDRVDVLKHYEKDNCEWVTMVTQSQHRRKPISGQSSKYKGVSFNKYMRKYKGSLKYYGKSYHLGYSDDAYKLALAYDKLLVELSGDVGGTNKELGLLD